MFMLGPLIERQMSEMLEPMITRIFGIMERAGKFPQPPDELSDREIKIEYMSILANIQKQSSFAGIQQILAMATTISDLQAGTGQPPNILDKIDCDEVIDQLVDMYVVPAGIVLGDDAVDEKRAKREEAQRQAQEQQQELAALQAGADAAPKIAGAGKDLAEMPMPQGGNGLEALAGMMNSGGGLM